MPLQLGDTVPNFTQKSTSGDINFYDWAGDSWVVLFSHPKDFTPVCTTELGLVAKLEAEWAKRGAKAIAVSVDPLDSHLGWVKDIEATSGAKVNYPLLADADLTVSKLYDMIHPNASSTATVRSVFIIDPQKKLRLTLTYPATTGRNFQEILRVIDSIQLTEDHSVSTPADWNQGEDVVISPKLQDPDELKRKFPGGYKTLTPYLRLGAAPVSAA